MSFFDRISDRSAAINSLLCVGLDPRLPADQNDAAHALEWCCNVIDATSEYAVAYRLNSACCEAHGAEGLGGLRGVCKNLRRAWFPQTA